MACRWHTTSPAIRRDPTARSAPDSTRLRSRLSSSIGVAPIGIGKQHEAAGCREGPGPDRRPLATVLRVPDCPEGWRILRGKAEHLVEAVGAAVVDNDHLVAIGEDAVAIPADRIQVRRQPLQFVIGRYDHGKNDHKAESGKRKAGRVPRSQAPAWERWACGVGCSAVLFNAFGVGVEIGTIPWVRASRAKGCV